MMFQLPTGMVLGTCKLKEAEMEAIHVRFCQLFMYMNGLADREKLVEFNCFSERS